MIPIEKDLEKEIAVARALLAKTLPFLPQGSPGSLQNRVLKFLCPDGVLEK